MVGRGGASPAEPGLGEGRQPIGQDRGLHAQRARLQRLLVPVVSAFLCKGTAARPCARRVGGCWESQGQQGVMQAGTADPRDVGRWCEAGCTCFLLPW